MLPHIPSLSASLLVLARLAGSEPTIAFPFNSQLPPVARLDHLYTYVFAPYTFRSDSEITYSLGDHPAWLKLESQGRRLYGIPDDASVPLGEVVGQNFDLIATDSSGSTSINATIVVSRNEEPAIKIPLTEQAERLGNFSAPSSLLSYPSTDFTYAFDPDTFQHKPEGINYYAVSGDGSPLPSWITFDGPSITFTGRTPPGENLIQPPQKFDFQLVASDIVGFSGVSLKFSIVVGNHRLTAENPILELKASRGKRLTYKSLAEEVKLDGRTVDPEDLKVSTDNLPQWLSFDASTWILSGSPEKGDRSTNFTIQFEDSYTDQLQILGTIDIQTRLFETTFDEVEATPGEDFDLNLETYFKDPADVEVTISTEPEQEWLNLKGLKLLGKVPRSASGDLEVTVKARSRSSDLEESEGLTITYLAPDGKTTALPSAASKTSTSDNPDQTDAGGNDHDEKDANKSDSGGIGTTAILLATIIPVLVIALLIMLLACFIRRRRARRNYLTANKSRHNISHPVAGSLRVNGSQTSIEHAETVMAPEKRMYKPEIGGYATVASQASSDSSNSLGSMSSCDQSHPGYRRDGETDPSRPLALAGTEEGRQSWYTIDRTPTNMRSEVSIKSRHSDITVPMSTHQLLPTPPFLSEHGGERTFRSIDLTLPSLEDLSTLPHGNLSYGLTDRSDAYTNVDVHSTISSSSAALPSSRHSSPKVGPSGFPSGFAAIAPRKSSNKSSSDKDWSTIREESEEGVPDLPQQPGHSRLASNQWPNRPRTADGSCLDRQSFRSDISFGSSENWRVISHGGRNTTNKGSISGSYRQLVDDAPFHPSRPSTAGAGAVRKVSLDDELIMPGKWSAAPTPVSSIRRKTPRSRFSRLNDDSPRPSTETNWRREDSGKASEGSFKAFI